MCIRITAVNDGPEDFFQERNNYSVALNNAKQN